MYFRSLRLIEKHLIFGYAKRKMHTGYIQERSVKQRFFNIFKHMQNTIIKLRKIEL